MKNIVFLEVLGMPGFKKHFLLIKALKRTILSGLERLVKKCKNKEGIGSGSAACCLSKKHTFLDVFCVFWPRVDEKHRRTRGILTFLSSS